MILLPDETMGDVYNTEIGPNVKKGSCLAFAHGFNIHFKQIVAPPEVDVSMIAPKAPGHRVRELFVEDVGVPALVAIHQNPSGKALDNALAYALGLGQIYINLAGRESGGIVPPDEREELVREIAERLGALRATPRLLSELVIGGVVDPTAEDLERIFDFRQERLPALLDTPRTLVDFSEGLGAALLEAAAWWPAYLVGGLGMLLWMGIHRGDPGSLSAD